MSKPQKDLQKAFSQVNKLCIFLNGYAAKLHFELLDKTQKNISLYQKARNNTIIGRRGDLPSCNSQMGITIKVTNKEINQYILLEPRINTPSKNHFKSTYLKGVRGQKSNILFLDSAAIFIVNDSCPKYYALYEYSQIPENNITKNNKGKGNAHRINLNSINVTPIPIEGQNSPLGEPGLEIAIIDLIKRNR